MKIKAIHYEKIKQSRVEMEGAKDVFIRWLVSKDDGAPNFYMRLFTIKKGGYTPYHKHNYEHEVFVLSGDGIVKIDEKEYSLSGGMVITVPADIMHQFSNNANRDFEFLCLIPKIE